MDVGAAGVRVVVDGADVRDPRGASPLLEPESGHTVVGDGVLEPGALLRVSVPEVPGVV